MTCAGVTGTLAGTLPFFAFACYPPRYHDPPALPLRQPMPSPKKQPASELRFEDAIERLEEIIERMETERVPLDDLLKDYEEGTNLLKICRERIGAARLRVEKINQDLARGSSGLESFDTGGEGSEEAVQGSSPKTSTPTGKDPNDDINLL